MTHIANDHVGDLDERGTSIPPSNKAVWLEALAALEAEFAMFQSQCSYPIDINSAIAPNTQIAAPDDIL